MGFALVGWIGGELLFMTETMVMTWVILGSGLLLIALAAPYAWPELKAILVRQRPTRSRRLPATRS